MVELWFITMGFFGKSNFLYAIVLFTTYIMLIVCLSDYGYYRLDCLVFEPLLAIITLRLFWFIYLVYFSKLVHPLGF